MNTYTPKTPRAALGLAAAAMATITMAAMVVLPAELEAAAPADEAATLEADATVDDFVARRILEADEMDREAEAERAVLAMPAPCLGAAEADTHGS
jgi:hypothetical protein